MTRWMWLLAGTLIGIPLGIAASFAALISWLKATAPKEEDACASR